jgi:RimJ/RimL family protein N-acetyltransferase
MNTLIERRQTIACLKGRKVILRPFDVTTDFELFLKWVNDPDVGRYLLRFVPIYRHQQLSWFQSLPNNTDVVFTTETLTGEIVGAIGLENINLVNGTACTWQIVGEKKYWGKGIGTEAKILLLEYAFQTLRLEKIGAEVMASNAGSLCYNEKCGFREEGRLRSHIFRGGARHDLILLGVLKEEFAGVVARYREMTAAF